MSAAEALLDRLESDIVLRRLRQLYREYLGIMGSLSDRQKEFVALRYEGDRVLPLAEVAGRMGLSERGVKWHVSELFKTLAHWEDGFAWEAA